MNFAFWFMKVSQSISGFSSQILSTINYNMFPTHKILLNNNSVILSQIGPS